MQSENPEKRPLVDRAKRYDYYMRPIPERLRVAIGVKVIPTLSQPVYIYRLHVSVLCVLLI